MSAGNYSELRFYSVLLDTQAARLSMFNDRHEEYFAVVPVAVGRAWRETKEIALDALVAAIESAAPIGEVVITADQIAVARRAMTRRAA